jgi:hypothetical protein
MKAKAVLVGFLLFGGLCAAEQPPNLPEYCYDTRCRGVFCLHGESGEATYCLGVKGFPSPDGEGNCCFCNVRMKYNGVDKSPDGHACWHYQELPTVPFPLEWCFEQKPDPNAQDRSCPYRVWVRCNPKGKWKLWSEAARCHICDSDNAKKLRERACKALD